MSKAPSPQKVIMSLRGPWIGTATAIYVLYFLQQNEWWAGPSPRLSKVEMVVLRDATKFTLEGG